MTRPFIIKIALELAAFAKAGGYTEEQILAVTPLQVRNITGIEVNNGMGKKYRFFESIIKSHVIQILFPTPPTMLDVVTSAALGCNPDAEIVQNGNVITVTEVE